MPAAGSAGMVVGGAVEEGLATVGKAFQPIAWSRKLQGKGSGRVLGLMIISALWYDLIVFWKRPNSWVNELCVGSEGVEHAAE